MGLGASNFRGDCSPTHIHRGLPVSGTGHRLPSGCRFGHNFSPRTGRRAKAIVDNYIDINDDDELYGWARRLGITPDELARLINALGPSAEAIRAALKKEALERNGGKDSA